MLIHIYFLEKKGAQLSLIPLNNKENSLEYCSIRSHKSFSHQREPMNMPSKIMETEIGSKDASLSHDKHNYPKSNDPESIIDIKMEASYMDRNLTTPRIGSPTIKV